MRLLGRWKPPNRSSDAVSHPPSPDRLTEIVGPFPQNPEPLDEHSRRMLISLQQIKTAAPAVRPSADAVWVPGKSELRGIRNRIRSL
jgi:hypothetical protein